MATQEKPVVTPYAVIETGGRQYLVKAGDTVKVNRLESKAGEELELRPVLAVSDGNELLIGKPEIKEARVTSKVVSHVRGDKVVSYDKKRRKGYSRKQGHRQELTVLKIESIGR